MSRARVLAASREHGEHGEHGRRQVRISALAEATGVPVATIKYYLREGLLAPGEATSATQAAYDQSHVQRLRLIRALLDVGGLSVTAAREVLAGLASDDVFDALGHAQQALPPSVPDDVDVTAAAEWVGAVGWVAHSGSTALRQLAVALAAVEAAGLPMDRERLETYARAAHDIAEHDIAGLPTGSTAEAVTYAVIGTVLYEPVLLALRRLAHQDVSGRLLAPERDWDAGPGVV